MSLIRPSNFASDKMWSTRRLKRLSGILAIVLALEIGIIVQRIYQKNVECCALDVMKNLYFITQELTRRITFNSQVGQDRWVIQSVYPGLREGYFVDVGSYDGVVLSNTKALEDLGWRGICIDPYPRNMKERSCSVFAEVVSDKAGEKVRFRAADELGGIEEFLNRGRGAQKVVHASIEEFTTTTLTHILDRAQAPAYIHYLSIDIEGAEFKALKGLDFSRYRIGALTIEHNFEEPKRTDIRALLQQKGYRLARSVDQDDFYLPK